MNEFQFNTGFNRYFKSVLLLIASCLVDIREITFRLVSLFFFLQTENVKRAFLTTLNNTTIAITVSE